MSRLLASLALWAFAAVGPSAHAQEETGRSGPEPRDLEGWAAKVIKAYPKAAMAAGEEGTVGVELAIDETGAVADCTVTRSSSWTRLDEAACSALKAHARFHPAMDSEGRPVPSTFSQAVRYTQGDNPGHFTHPVPIGLQDWRPIVFDHRFDKALAQAGHSSAKFQLVVSETGGAVGCGVISSTGDAKLDRETCAKLLEHARFEPAALNTGEKIPGAYWLSHTLDPETSGRD